METKTKKQIRIEALTESSQKSLVIKMPQPFYPHNPKILPQLNPKSLHFFQKHTIPQEILYTVSTNVKNNWAATRQN